MQHVTRLTPRWYDGLAFTFLSDRHYVLIIREEHGMSNEVTKGMLSAQVRGGVVRDISVLCFARRWDSSCLLKHNSGRKSDGN